MIPLRRFRWTYTIQKLEKRRISDAYIPYRRPFRASSRGSLKTICTVQNSPISLSIWRNSPVLFKPSGPTLLKRFASTDANSPTILESPPTPVDQPWEPLPDFTSSPLDTITDLDVSQIGEHIGFLKELGLNFGWGPTSSLQYLLEHVHIYAGTPWWGSILLTALFVRVILLKAYINASDVSARMAIVNPNIEPLKARLKASRDAKDADEMKRVAMELRQVYKSANIQLWRVWVPMLQMPIGFGTFRLLRNMADLPVPGLENGGLLWIKDLTLSDPYFFLPVITGLAFHITFRKGGELGASQSMNPALKHTMLYAFPVLMTTFMLYWPAALQLTFAITSMLSLTQAHLLKEPWMREWLGIQPLPKPKSPSSKSAYTGTLTKYQTPAPSSDGPAQKGIFEGAISDLKGAASQVVKSARAMRSNLLEEKTGTQRRTPTELRRAKAYEEKRRREISQAKFEVEQKWKERRENARSRRRE